MGQIPNNSRPSDLNGVEDSHIVQYFIFHSSIYVGSSLLYPTILRFAHDGLGHTSFPLLLSSPGNQHDPSLKYSHNGSGPHCSGNKFQIGCSIPFSRFILSPCRPVEQCPCLEKGAPLLFPAIIPTIRPNGNIFCWFRFSFTDWGVLPIPLRFSMYTAICHDPYLLHTPVNPSPAIIHNEHVPAVHASPLLHPATPAHVGSVTI